MNDADCGISVARQTVFAAAEITSIPLPLLRPERNFEVHRMAIKLGPLPSPGRQAGVSALHDFR
jgi:hypothetical protein